MSDERSEAEERASQDEEGSAEAQSREGDGDEPEDSGETGDDGQGAGDGDQSSGGEIDEEEDPKAVVKKLEEEGPPERLEDWPQGKAKYETFGGPEGEHGYHEGPEQQMGPSSLRFHEEGDVEIEGERVDDPDEYKGEPIPGGPTDPDAPDATGETSDEPEDEDGGGSESEGDGESGGPDEGSDEPSEERSE
jgi:hypothetical protein